MTPTLGLSSCEMEGSSPEVEEAVESDSLVTCKCDPSRVPSFRRRAVLAADSFSNTITAVCDSAPGVRVMDEILGG